LTTDIDVILGGSAEGAAVFCAGLEQPDKAIRKTADMKARSERVIVLLETNKVVSYLFPRSKIAR